MENMNFIDLQDALRTQPDETLTSIKDKANRRFEAAEPNTQVGKSLMIRSTHCRRGHKLKMGKDGRQRCPICQSAYLRKWRAKNK